MSFLFVLQMMAAWYGIVIFVVWLVAVMVFRRKWRIRNISLTILILSLLPLIYLFGDQPEAIRRQSAEAEDRRKRYAESKAIFDELCKDAGIKIMRNPGKVDGIALSMPNPAFNVDMDANNYPNAALLSEGVVEIMVENLLFYEATDDRSKGYRGVLSFEAGDKSIAGLSWVEVDDSGEKARQRFSLSGRKERPVTEVPPSAGYPRYKLMVEYDLTPSIRSHWIAGVNFKIIDQSDGRSVATFRRYVMDPGQGDSTNGRRPWVRAIQGGNVCPVVKNFATDAIARHFVSQVFGIN